MAKEGEKKGKGAKIAIVISIVAIIALLVVVIILLTQRKSGKEEETKRNTVVNQSNAEQLAEELLNEPYVEPGYYSTQMSTEWHLATGDAVSEDAYVKNDAGNTNDVYFDVFLEDDESTPILESPVIPRGSEMDNISLDKSLSAGTYKETDPKWLGKRGGGFPEDPLQKMHGMPERKTGSVPGL